MKTSTDQGGEKTINRQAKTTDWCFNIPFRGHTFITSTKVTNKIKIYPQNVTNFKTHPFSAVSKTNMDGPLVL